MNKVQLSHLKDVDMVTLNKKYRLFSLHFENSMFKYELKNLLVSNAIPTLFEVVTEKNVEEEQTIENVMMTLNLWMFACRPVQHQVCFN